MWLLQKNLPAIVVVVVYAKEIMALSRGKRLPSPHSFLPLINTKGDGLETPWPVIPTFFPTLTFHALHLLQPFKSSFCRRAC